MKTLGLIFLLSLAGCASMPQNSVETNRKIFAICDSYADKKIGQAEQPNLRQQYFQSCLNYFESVRQQFMGSSAAQNNQYQYQQNQGLADMQQGFERMGRALSRQAPVQPVTNCVTSQGFGNTINTTCTGP